MPRGIPQWLTTGALLIGSLAVSAVVLNYAAKLIYESNEFQQTHRNGIRAVEYALKQRADIYGEDSSIIPHPYLLYANRPGFTGQGFRQIDDRGYRIVPQPPRPSGAPAPKRILILGGSTTFSYPYVPDPANAWPSQLQNRLGPDFEVINAGLSSATSAELLAGYVFRHRYLKPDIVIIHEGGNDVLATMFPNYSPEYEHLRGPGTRPVAGPLDRTWLRFGGWPAMMLYAHNWNNMTTVFSPMPTELGSISPRDAIERAEHAPTVGFARNIDLLVRTILADGGTPILFGFVQAREPMLSRQRPDLIGREHAWIVAVERNLETMKKTAGEYRLAYIDPHDFKADDNWFIDNCHLNEIGEAAKAAFVADALRFSPKT